MGIKAPNASAANQYKPPQSGTKSPKPALPNPAANTGGRKSVSKRV
jgi:hypothetical protein